MTEILEVSLNAIYNGVQFINRWNYLATGTAPPEGFAFGLNDAMGFHPVAGVPPVGSILAKLITFLAAGCEFVQSICINPYDPEDFDAQPFVPRVIGADTTQPAAPFLAIGFRTNQVRRDIRRGTKRFGGITETMMDANGAIPGGGITIADDLATLMGATLTYTDGSDVSTYTPAIVKKEKYAVPGSSPVRYAYRYLNPLNDTSRDAQVLLCATGFVWEPYSDVRSQVSRQYGRGI